MSLAHASNPSAGTSRLVCEVPSCRRTEAPTLVRLRAPGRRFPESRWLCRHHQQEALDEGLVIQESPVPTTCLVPDCATIVAARGLCQRHYQLARSRSLIQPGERGPAPASVIAALSTPLELETVKPPPPVNPEAVAALELPRVQRPRIRPAMPVPELASALGKKPEDASYRECLALVREREDERTVWHQRITMMMEALPRHLFAGGERLDQMVVGVCKLLRRAEETVQPLATRYRTTSLGAIVGAAMLDLQRLDAVTAALDQFGAPDAEVGSDGTPATRLGLLIRYWQDAIRSALPGDVDGGGSDGGPLDFTLSEIAQAVNRLTDERDTAFETGRKQGALEAEASLRQAGNVALDQATEELHTIGDIVAATPDGGRLIAAEMALDEAKAPAAESLVERIRLLVGAHAQEVAEATERAAAREGELLGHLSAIRQALNVGPPSASDVRPGTPWAEVARIVRARSVQMLEERDQRVALANRLLDAVSRLARLVRPGEPVSKDQGVSELLDLLERRWEQEHAASMDLWQALGEPDGNWPIDRLLRTAAAELQSPPRPEPDPSPFARQLALMVELPERGDAILHIRATKADLRRAWMVLKDFHLFVL